MDDATTPPIIDTDRRFVRVVERRADGFVEFRFSIGDPDLFVEMFLDGPAFAEFCATQHAEVLADVGAPGSDETGDAGDEWGWTLHDATHQRFK